MIVGALGRGTLSVTDSGIVTVSGGTVTLGQASTGTGVLNIGTGGVAGTLNTATITGGAGRGTVNFNHTGALAFAPTLRGTLSVNKLASGTTIWTADHTYTGTTTISGGTLQIGDGGATGRLGSGSVVNNGALAFQRSGTLVVSANISGTGTVTQNGLGTLILSGSNSYTGATVLASGITVINGNNSAATGDVTVQNGARLHGTGTIGGNVDIFSGGKLAIGESSPGLLSLTGNLALNDGANLELRLFGEGPGEYDQLFVGGDFTTENARLTLTINYSVAYGDTFQIFTSGGYDGGSFDILSNIEGYTWDTSQLASSGIITVVPEPGTWTMVAAGLGLILLFRRKSLRHGTALGG
jgi:fibronectin-binding autotransporter adhesin